MNQYNCSMTNGGNNIFLGWQRHLSALHKGTPILYFFIHHFYLGAFYISLERRQRVEAHCLYTVFQWIMWFRYIFLIAIVSCSHLNGWMKHRNIFILYDYCKWNNQYSVFIHILLFLPIYGMVTDIFGFWKIFKHSVDPSTYAQ